MPSSEEEWQRIAAKFKEWNFPNCMGATDGKHVLLKQPAYYGSYYFNYKGTFSLVLLGLVDGDYKFTYVDVGCNGRVSDGDVFRNSSLSRALFDNLLNIPGEWSLCKGITVTYVIATDDAFLLKTYKIKPYALRGISEEKLNFNYHFNRARNIVENIFGILASWFCILLHISEYLFTGTLLDGCFYLW